MNIYIVIAIGLILSSILHFAGSYTNSKKTVWLVIVLLWAGTTSIALSEIKPEGYDYIKKIEGKYQTVDTIIQSSLPKISVYELLCIKKAYIDEENR